MKWKKENEMAKENKFNNDDDDETDATSTDSSDTKSSLNNEDEDAGLHDDALVDNAVQCFP